MLVGWQLVGLFDYNFCQQLADEVFEWFQIFFKHKMIDGLCASFTKNEGIRPIESNCSFSINCPTKHSKYLKKTIGWFVPQLCLPQRKHQEKYAF